MATQSRGEPSKFWTKSGNCVAEGRAPIDEGGEVLDEAVLRDALHEAVPGEACEVLREVLREAVPGGAPRETVLGLVALLGVAAGLPG
eukprot:10778682-Alexandrium_andersonii.AAC.1